jgi:hypothetical protein
MALVSSIRCEKCGKAKDVWYSSSQGKPRICADCTAEAVAKKRAEHFAELDKLSIHDRLRRVEEWQYDYEPQYLPPPRF